MVRMRLKSCLKISRLNKLRMKFSNYIDRSASDFFLFRGLSRLLLRLKTFKISTSMDLRSANIVTTVNQVGREEMKGIITTTTLTISTIDTVVAEEVAVAVAGEMPTFTTIQLTKDWRPCPRRQLSLQRPHAPLSPPAACLWPRCHQPSQSARGIRTPTINTGPCIQPYSTAAAPFIT